MDVNDTIAAISTPMGEGGIGIVRVSGDKAVEIIEKIFRPSPKQKGVDWESHRLYYGGIVSAFTGQVIDEVLVSVMFAPRTYTREDVVEINCHGGIVPVRQIFIEVTKLGARIAEPGEFTRRAFLNGRIDLAQAEAVIDVIRAKTDRCLRVALQQLEGRLSESVRAIQADLLGLLARIEAAIDFPDQEIAPPPPAVIRELAMSIEAALQGLLATADQGKIMREGLQTAIIGKPNVGKSSLLNALLREQRAIVTAVPGTTRDIIEESVNIQGIPLRIVDTAGIRASGDEVEQLGIARSAAAIQAADMILFVLDNATGITEEDREIARRIDSKQCLVLINKSDVNPLRLTADAVQEILPARDVLSISVRTGDGMNALEDWIAAAVFRGDVSGENDAVVSNVRHSRALDAALVHIREVISGAEADVPVDLISIDVREAWEKLGEITGSTVTADVLDEIFSQFCIGK